MKSVKNKYLSIILLVVLSSLNYLCYYDIYANKLIVDIEPDCGKLKNYRIDMMVNGFNTVLPA